MGRLAVQILGAIVGIAFACSASAYAQDAPVRVRGAITKVEGNIVTVTARNGAAMTVRLVGNARVVAIVKATLGDIKPGSFIGTTAKADASGTMQAVEVHIFPESMRGTGEGHRAWDLGPSTTMTNGTVAQAVEKVEGNTLTVKYKEGEKTVLVTPDTAIVTYLVSDRQDLKPGAKVFIGAATKTSDGTLETDRINVGRDGLTPPM
jgi:hypothetical protein